MLACATQALPKAAGAAATTAAAASRGAGQAGGKTAKSGGGQGSSDDSSSDADDAIPAATANGGGASSTGDSSSGEESGQGGGFDLAKLKAKSGKRRTAGPTPDASKGKPAVPAAASKKKMVRWWCACLDVMCQHYGADMAKCSSCAEPNII